MSELENWQDIFKSNAKVSTYKRIDSLFEFSLKEINQTIKVKIWEDKGQFYGTTDLKVKSPNANSSYTQNNCFNSAEEALKEAIWGITTSIFPPFENVVFEKNNLFKF